MFAGVSSITHNDNALLCAVAVLNACAHRSSGDRLTPTTCQMHQSRRCAPKSCHRALIGLLRHHALSGCALLSRPWDGWQRFIMWRPVYFNKPARCIKSRECAPESCHHALVGLLCHHLVGLLWRTSAIASHSVLATTLPDWNVNATTAATVQSGEPDIFKSPERSTPSRLISASRCCSWPSRSRS